MDGFVDRIKHYPAKEQAELRVRINIPGSWFNNLHGAERGQQYEGEANGYELAYKFPKKGERKAMTCEGVRFVCKDDVFEDPTHSGFIMPIEEWNRYRHYTYKDNREAEEPYIPGTVAVVADATPADKASERPAIYSEFELMSSGTHTSKRRDGTSAQVNCEYWRCLNTSGRCKNRKPYKVIGKASGKLFAHLKKCNPAAHVRVKLTQSGQEADDDGNLIAIISFKELLPAHAQFTIMIVMEWDNLWKCRSAERKKWARRLKPGASVPHRNTCIKLMRVIHGLMGIKLDKVLADTKAELGSPYAGAQDDVWSMKNCRESFGCLRISLIIKILGGLLDVNPLVAFATFPTSSHTGAVIAAWKKRELAHWKMDAKADITLWTEDGAAPNIKSSKILGVPYETCGPHQVQRANLAALGMGNATSKNPAAKAVVARMSKQASSFHSSGIACKALQAAQIARGVKEHAVKSTEMANATRWTGIFRCAVKTRVLEDDIKVSLTGEKDGICIEDPAPVFTGDSPDDDERSSEADEEAAREDEDSDGEQVAANVAADKKFPLAQRCLSQHEFQSCNQMESAMTPSHETVMLMQKLQGVDPGTSHILAAGCKSLCTAGKLMAVSGTEGKEVWKEMNALSLALPWRRYREIFVKEMTKRFKLNRHPGLHVILCWKMNPSVDTTRSAALFAGKQSVFDLMEGEYMLKLKRRSMSAAATSGAAMPGAATPGAATPGAATEAAATVATTTLAVARPQVTAAATATPPPAGSSKKRKLSILGAISQFSTSANNPTAVDDTIAAEIDKFAAIKLGVATEGKYMSGGFFDNLAFYNDYQAALPIHTKVWRGDVGCMKGAAANVESIFSGIKRLLGDFAATMSPDILFLYVFIHYNWQYEWMRPSIDEIVKTYIEVYGEDPREEDVEEEEETGEEEGDEEEEEQQQ